VVWDDGTEECLLCGGDRQIARMTQEQLKNVAYHMPDVQDWKP
jgi:hypothetical protein